MENLYSVEEAAIKLGGISKHTVVLWLSKGKLRRTKIGRRTMIKESELNRFIAGIPVDTQMHSATATQDAMAVK